MGLVAVSLVHSLNETVAMTNSDLDVMSYAREFNILIATLAQE